MIEAPVTSEIVADIYVFAAADGGFGYGAYEIYVNSDLISEKQFSLSVKSASLSYTYFSAILRAFTDAADYVGKKTIVEVDPRMEILSRRTDQRPSGLKEVAARNIFRFHIPNRRVLDVCMGKDGTMNMKESAVEQKSWRLLYSRMLELKRTKTPYRNLKLETMFEFNETKESEVAEMATVVNNNLKIRLAHNAHASN